MSVGLVGADVDGCVEPCEECGSTDIDEWYENDVHYFRCNDCKHMWDNPCVDCPDLWACDEDDESKTCKRK